MSKFDRLASGVKQMVFYVLDSLVKMGETVGERAEEEDEKKKREGGGKEREEAGSEETKGKQVVLFPEDYEEMMVMSKLRKMMMTSGNGFWIDVGLEDESLIEEAESRFPF